MKCPCCFCDCNNEAVTKDDYCMRCDDLQCVVEAANESFKNIHYPVHDSVPLLSDPKSTKKEKKNPIQPFIPSPSPPPPPPPPLKQKSDSALLLRYRPLNIS